MTESMDESTAEMLTDVYDRIGRLNSSIQELVALAAKLKAPEEQPSPEGETAQLPLNLAPVPGRPTLFDELCGGITDTEFVSKLQAALGITQAHPQWEEAAFRILYALEAHEIVKFILDGDERIVLWVDVGE